MNQSKKMIIDLLNNYYYKSNMKYLSIVALFALILVAVCQLHADPITTYLTDEKGRFIFYHGLNVVYKQFPYYPKTDAFDPLSSLSQEDFRMLRDWGFRALRLYVAWEGFQPKEGQYNYSYLQKVRQITRQAKKYDISILLDAHQDLYSKRFCGEGFPEWLVTRTTFPAPLKVDLKYDQNENPLKSSCMQVDFFKYYITDDIMRFQHDFFTNKNGMADKFVMMWVNVVSFFKGQSNILGYDLLNQPSGANGWKNIYDMLGPNVNNNKLLLPLYRKLSKAIRQVDQQKLIFFQPSVADYFGGFYETPSGPQYSSKDVLSYHTYCPFKNAHNQPSSVKKCKAIDYIYMQQRMKNVKKLKCGSMMTQFGSMPETEAGLAETARVLREADKHWQSWFWWQYKYNQDSTCSTNPPWQQSFFYSNGTLMEKKVFQLSYPYAYAVCGTPITQQHSLNTYVLQFVPRVCGNETTEIYLNEDMYFPKGFTVSYSPKCPDCILRNYQKNYYRLIVPTSNLNRKLQVRVGGYI